MRKRINRIILSLAAALGGLAVPPSTACPYNVRESGFVDLGLERYFLFCYVDEHGAASLAPTLEQRAKQTLRDTRVVFEIVRPDVQDDHPALKYLAPSQAGSFPRLVLVSPTESTMAIPVGASGSASLRAFEAAFRKVAVSPFRRKLIGELARNYGVVLLVEGADSQANGRAAEAAHEAIKAISGQMDFMPKPIARGPVLLRLPRSDFSGERILLWSLGVDGVAPEQPRAAVIYGRARRIGRVLRGDEITRKALYDILRVVGADCECGIDPRWIRGRGIRVRWDRETRAAVAADLGFDPENPMVITEVSQIMRMRTSFYPWAFAARTKAAAPADDLPVPFVGDSKPGPSGDAAGDSVLAMLLYTLAGMAGLAGVAAVFMAVRAARRNP